MGKTFFFENINILMGPNIEVAKDNLLIIDGKIEAFGDEAKKEAFKKNISISKSMRPSNENPYKKQTTA